MIVQYPDPILSAVATPVTDFTSLKELVMQMRCAMVLASGIGIAANQIGDPRAVCIVKDLVMVNPVITRHIGEFERDLEGCLSLDGHGAFPRLATGIVEVEYQTIKGKKVKKTFKGFDARIVQHEVRHLNGKLINEGYENA